MKRDLGWSRTREKILMVFGLSLIVAQFVWTEMGGPFHVEFLILAGGLCGVSLTQRGDKKP